MRSLRSILALALIIGLGTGGCDFFSDSDTEPPDPLSGTFEFAAPVLDIDATADGTILVAEDTSIKAIGREGVEDLIEMPTIPGSPINGLQTIGQGSFLATSGGLDLAAGAGLWRVSDGAAELVADIEAFETENDPDALEGPQWKDQRCEENEDFTAGPQSNPYHLKALTVNTALVADGAGNSLLTAGTDGAIDWVAVFAPPVDENGDWRVLFPLNEETDCYVQPVPTSVDVGPDGAYYVGELTGVTPGELAGEFGPTLSRVWRILPGSRNVVCPSDDCEKILSDFTSIIDLMFGPNGFLYVVEFDENGWFAATEMGNSAGGTIHRCAGPDDCTVLEEADVPLGAITFDVWGQLWVVENNFATGIATVRQVGGL